MTDDQREKWNKEQKTQGRDHAKPRRARICWQSKVTGDEDQGAWVSEEKAREFKAYADRYFPDTDHWIEYEGEG